MIAFALAASCRRDVDFAQDVKHGVVTDDEYDNTARLVQDVAG